MKMTAKQKAVLRQIAPARGEITIRKTDGTGGVRVWDAVNASGCKVNLQVDWLVAKGYAEVKECSVPSHAALAVVVTARGEKILSLYDM